MAQLTLWYCEHAVDVLSPIHTSDNVAKNRDIVAETRDIVAETRDIVAKSRDIVAETRDIVAKNGNNIEGAVDKVPPEAKKNMWA